MSNISTLYTSIMRLISYLKGYTVDIIDQQLFEEIRDNFEREYQFAAVFYNTSNVGELLRCCQDILKAQLQEEQTNNPELQNNQYESLLRTINKSYENINTEVIVQVVKTIGEEEIDAQREQLKLLIKALIITQVFNNMNEIIENTINNNGEYNYISEYNNDLNSIMVEHINECNYLLEELMNNNTQLLFFHESYDNDEIMPNQAEYLETAFLGADDYTEKDNNVNQGITIMHGNTRLDEFIFKLLYRNVMTLKIIINKVIDFNNIILLPNINYVMFWLIVLMMHITSNY